MPYDSSLLDTKQSHSLPKWAICFVFQGCPRLFPFLPTHLLRPELFCLLTSRNRLQGKFFKWLPSLSSAQPFLLFWCSLLFSCREEEIPPLPSRSVRPEPRRLLLSSGGCCQKVAIKQNHKSRCEKCQSDFIWERKSPFAFPPGQKAQDAAIWDTQQALNGAQDQSWWWETS